MTRNEICKKWLANVFDTVCPPEQAETLKRALASTTLDVEAILRTPVDMGGTRSWIELDIEGDVEGGVTQRPKEKREEQRSKGDIK